MEHQQSAVTLANDRLHVELSIPGSDYRGSRFDWIGFISQVILDGEHSFCVPESLKPASGTGGNGLCNEFGIDLPIGFEEAKPGELFPKPGVGLLRKPDKKPYDFARPYEIAQPFTFHLECTSAKISVVVDPLDCRGYAIRLEKQFCLQANNLEISYRLENCGEKQILTNEYAHNFVAIDRQPIGPDYFLRLPYTVTLEDPQMLSGKDLLVIKENTIGFLAPLSVLYLRLQGYSQTSRSQWEMRLQSNRVGLSENDDFNPVRVAIWGTYHVLSPEIFVGIDLQPGTVFTWNRRYTFYD